MNWRITNKQLLTAPFAILVVLTLLFSFGLHSVQVAHSHPNHAEHQGHTHGESQEHKSSGSTLGEYMHAADKKLLLILAALSMLALGLVTTLSSSWEHFILHKNLLLCTFFKKSRETALSTHNYLKWCFCKGILHPKLH